MPGPGLEPGWIAPTVFETVASTDSAIRAGAVEGSLRFAVAKIGILFHTCNKDAKKFLQ